MLMWVLLAYILPIYLVIWLLAPAPLEALLGVSWLLMLVLGALWSLSWDRETVPPWPPTVACPRCGLANPAERLLCQECFAELYGLDEHGELVPLSPAPPRERSPWRAGPEPPL